MRAKTNESPGIKSKMDDVAEAMAAVKRDLIEVLPKMRRAGRTDVSDLKVSVNAAGLGAPLRRGVSTGGCRGGLLPRCTCAYRPWAGATSCGLPRSSDCVGFCVAFPQEPSFSRRKTKLCVVLLGELSSQGAAPARMEPHREAFIKRYRRRHPVTKARSRPGSLVPSRWPSSHSPATPRLRRRSRPFREDRGGSHSLAPNLPAVAPPE